MDTLLNTRDKERVKTVVSKAERSFKNANKYAVSMNIIKELIYSNDL